MKGNNEWIPIILLINYFYIILLSIIDKNYFNIYHYTDI